jgi:hypothetical protein
MSKDNKDVHSKKEKDHAAMIKHAQQQQDSNHQIQYPD